MVQLSQLDENLNLQEYVGKNITLAGAVKTWRTYKLTKNSPMIFRSDGVLFYQERHCEHCNTTYDISFWALPQTKQLVILCHSCLPKSKIYKKYMQKLNRIKNISKQNQRNKINYLQRRTQNMELKKQVMNHYTNGTMNCVCCGCHGLEFLTVDHIDNDGAEHRRQIPHNTIYKNIIENAYPKNIRILCFNCNTARQHNSGICPHNKPDDILGET